MLKNSKMIKDKNVLKKGSATVVIVITAVVFLVYISSAYTDILHLKKMHEKYYTDIQNLYNMEYNYIESLL